MSFRVVSLLRITGLSLVLMEPGLQAAQVSGLDAHNESVDALLQRMTLAEKVGQMSQVNGAGGTVPDEMRAALRAGRIGSVLNEVDVTTVNELQRIAVKESRLGIPLLIGRDVIHGFRTVLPIPLGLAATWNPELVEQGARMAAREAASAGINWTFAPMIDVSRDPRWGRIAESLGEDPYLHSVLGSAMIRGFQGDDLTRLGSLVACAKHFAGYGASESGRDYNTTNIPENELRNVYLRPFKAAVDAGVATLMTSFSDLDGIPATANQFLLRRVLRDEWGFRGFVVSDWASIEQLRVHGLTSDDRASALAAIRAGVNMEMATSTYENHLPGLLADGRIDEALVDEMVAGVLRVKFALGLFDNPYTDPSLLPPTGNEQHLAVAREAALQSLVLLENRDGALPLRRDALDSIAVIGPLADDAYEQLGTWIFDGDPTLSVTPLEAIRNYLGEGVKLQHVRGLETSRSRATDGFAEAVQAVRDTDVTIVFLGEESILSGEAHSRADIGLPGAQTELVRVLSTVGKPLIAVILAGRPLTLGDIEDEVEALLYAWHPGSMAGPAIADVLFGVESPSGKLPVTFPRMVGQVPVYYAHKHTGKPATPDSFRHIDDIPVRMPQSSSGFVSSHLDAGYTPRYPFGHGLSYTEFVYSDIRLSQRTLRRGEVLEISAELRNAGTFEAEEIVQLYVRDRVGSVTRPVRELQGFQRIRLAPGDHRRISFSLEEDDLAFYGADMTLRAEPGDFEVWVGGSSEARLQAGFTLVD